jgi:hypothetical protein
MVICRFKPGVGEATIRELLGSVHALQSAIPGILSVESGPYDSPEGMNQGYTHGFLVTFDTAQSRNTYLDHPAHDVVRDNLIAQLEGAIAFDFEVT